MELICQNFFYFFFKQMFFFFTYCFNNLSALIYGDILLFKCIIISLCGWYDWGRFARNTYPSVSRQLRERRRRRRGGAAPVKRAPNSWPPRATIFLIRFYHRAAAIVVRDNTIRPPVRARAYKYTRTRRSL